MGGAIPSEVRPYAPKCVLLVVADPMLAELLAETLTDAGHVPQVATPGELLAGEADCAIFDVAIVDLDTWDRSGAGVISRLRAESPLVTVIAFFPCGALASDFTGVPYHLALEKPARLHAVLAAIAAAGLEGR